MKHVLQFRIELLGITPPVWRRIQVPADYTLWDLHVAIQDCMGWEDRHLHAFRVVGSDRMYGIPDREGPGDRATVADHEVEVDSVFTPGSAVGTYEYDFGDGWVHLLVLEGYEPAVAGATYPLCMGGERNCPPENSGGPHMYSEALRVREDPSHPEHEMFEDWLRPGFDPESFEPGGVSFSDPEERWRNVFS